MNLKTIRYFITLSHCLNFTQAANQYHITQTAMSRYIASLETQLGVKLFDRSSRSVRLTEAGKVYAEGMERILKEYEELQERTQAAASRFQGHIKVGIGIYEYANTEQYFSDFLELYPDIKVEIFQYSYSMLTQLFKTDDLDLIIALDVSRREFHREEIHAEELFSAENVLVMNREKAKRYMDSPVEEILKKEYLVTNCEDDGPSSMKMLKGLLQRDLGFVPENIIQTNSLGAQLLMLKTGHGVGLVPAFLKEIQDPELQVRTLPQKEPQHYCLMIKSESRNPAAELFLNYCSQITPKL